MVPTLTHEQMSAAAIEMADRLARENGKLRAEVAHLRKALKFYAEATDAEWQNDHGFNAEAALAT